MTDSLEEVIVRFVVLYPQWFWSKGWLRVPVDLCLLTWWEEEEENLLMVKGSAGREGSGIC